MSAKWRALQHRHRYTYNAVIFPQAFIDSLNSVQLQDQACAKFFTELAELVSLNSIYAQVNHVKKVTSSFCALSCNANEDLISVASKLYLEVLFCERSLPLHRTLVSGLLKIRNFHSEIGACFRKLCQDYGVVQHGKGKRFCVCRVALSIMGMPKLGYLVAAVEECAILVTRDIVFSLNSVVSETNEWARPSPIVMEQCQESLSCLYYLLQRFPKSFQDSKSFGDSLIEQDSNVLEVVFPVLLSVLKSSAFSRDCFVAAGVSLCAALQVCLSSQDLGQVVIEGIFCQTIHSSLTNFNSMLCDIAAKVPYKGDLCSEICDFSSLSRLCLIRGILTTFSRAVLNFQHVVSGGNNTVKTILYDGVLPELCNYCENPTDSHFNFHSLTVMQICLQQIKTSMQANISDLSSSYDPLPEEMGGRILRIIWNNLEDPLSQTVKQVHLIFDLFLDIRSTLYWSEGEKIKTFLQKIASDLLRLGPRCKGRYVPLASLTKRLGAKTILCMNSEILFETMKAYIDDDVCCAATSFLKCFLEHLRDECWSSDGIENGYAVYRGYCLPPILYGLGSGVSKLRSNLNTYALPVLLEIDLDSIFPMLAFTSVGPKGVENELLHSEFNPGRMELRNEQKVAILVSLLKVSRFLALMEGDVDWSEDPTIKHKNGVTEAACLRYARVCIKGVEVEILVEWLVMALTHVDESLRVDAAETLFLNPKTSSLPSHLELTLLKEAVPWNMRCCSTAFQMKWNSLFRKFFSRVRTALERQLKQGNWRPLSCSESHEESLIIRSEETLDSRANDLFLFMRWLGGFLFLSCYPSAPYKRKIMSMELILIMFSVWPDMPSFQEDFGSFSPETYLCPYNKGIASPDLTLLLVGSIVDSWDRLRENSVRILLHFPTPLPGISSEAMVCKLVTWAKILVCSQRVRESDAGALTLRLIFRKYVLKLGWMIGASVNVVCFPSHSAMANESDEIHKYKQPMLEYLKSLIDWLEVSVEKGEKDLTEACNNSFVHGVLLTLRYTFEEIDWNSDVILSSVSEMRNLLEKLLELVMRITSLALWVVSADAWYLQDDMDDIIDGDNFSMDIPNVVELSNPSPELDEKRSPLYDTRASEQIVMVGCWLAMKEVSLLLGTIIRKIPLPDASFSDSLGSGDIFSDALKNNEVLDLRQLQTIGSHFLDVLLKMKHNGAIDKTRAGFTALCNRLLCSNDPRLCRLTEYWMEQLMERTVAKGQIVDDLLRRSAGIPAAFTALFLSEPEGAPKKLLPRALRWLIDVAKRSMLDPVKTDNGNGDLVETESERANQYPKSSLPVETNTNEKASKIRDEGVVPTVHAFNVLRAAFNDTNLAADTSGFSAEALIVSISAFSSPYWEVRNSACQAYTALVRRMIGFLNVQKRESARRALSGLEFFHRYPSLHLFLFNELKVATVLLEDGSSKGQQLNLKSIVHPSLCPVLILLSRLKPSTIASESNDELDPFLLVPFIRRCSTQSNLRVRLLASRALTGLVSNEKLPSVLLKIASELPSDDAHLTTGNSFNWMHGTLLQLHALLDTNCKNLADFLKKDHILTDLLQVLLKCTRIADPKQCPCPVLNASFIQMLDHMLSIAQTCPESKSLTITRDLVLNLTTKSLNFEASSRLLAFDPTIIDLRKQAAISYFNCVFQRSKDEADEIPKFPPTSLLNKQSSETPVTDHLFSGLQEKLISSLQDLSYEVRLVTLKWLLNFLKSTKSDHNSSVHEIMTIQNWCKTDLQVTLAGLLTSETNHRCVHYILRIIFTWNLLQFQNFDRKKCSNIVFVGRMDIALVFQFWNQLVSLHDRARHLKTRETIICCMGVCIKRIVGLFSTAILCRTGKMISIEYTCSDQIERLYGYMTQYADLIKKNSKYTEPVTMRKAAAESIVVSGLLEEVEIIGSSVSNNKIPSKTPQSHLEPNEMVNMYARLLLDMWFTCLRLLEDEDDEIRQKLAIDVQKCFVSKSSSGSSHIPFQVEKVIASSFDHLSSIFGHWIEYSDFLSDWVLEGANFTISQRDLVQRVFDKEIDNHHEERLLVIQICCCHLEKILKTHMVDLGDDEWFKEYVYNWRMRFCRKLISFAEEYVCKNGEDDWIGGVGNHKDVFLPIYANLLGFYAFSCSIFEENKKDLPPPPELVEVGNVISPFLTNPLIFNLYLLLLRKLEKTGVRAVSRSIGNYSFWEDFNPYFLIR